MPRVKQRTPELRSRVLHTAIDTLAREGAAGFTARRVAQDAATSTPAVYELFGDKAGLVRELFFEGFRLLGERLQGLPLTDDPRADVVAALACFRHFVVDNPVLADLMFSRPFAEFDPRPDDVKAGAAVRRHIVARVSRAIKAGVVTGREHDIAHILVAMAQGLAAQEAGGWLGSSTASVERKWHLAVNAVLDGLRPVDASRTPRRRP